MGSKNTKASSDKVQSTSAETSKNGKPVEAVIPGNKCVAGMERSDLGNTHGMCRNVASKTSTRNDITAAPYSQVKYSLENKNVSLSRTLCDTTDGGPSKKWHQQKRSVESHQPTVDQRELKTTANEHSRKIEATTERKVTKMVELNTRTTPTSDNRQIYSNNSKYSIKYSTTEKDQDGSNVKHQKTAFMVDEVNAPVSSKSNNVSPSYHFSKKNATIQPRAMNEKTMHEENLRVKATTTNTDSAVKNFPKTITGENAIDNEAHDAIKPGKTSYSGNCKQLGQNSTNRYFQPEYNEQITSTHSFRKYNTSVSQRKNTNALSNNGAPLVSNNEYNSKTLVKDSHNNTLDEAVTPESILCVPSNDFTSESIILANDTLLTGLGEVDDKYIVSSDKSVYDLMPSPGALTPKLQNSYEDNNAVCNSNKIGFTNGVHNDCTENRRVVSVSSDKEESPSDCNEISHPLVKGKETEDEMPLSGKSKDFKMSLKSTSLKNEVNQHIKTEKQDEVSDDKNATESLTTATQSRHFEVPLDHDCVDATTSINKIVQ